MQDLFLKIIAGEIPSYKIYENDHVYAFLDIHPVTKAHTLVVPKKWSKNLLDINDESLCEVMKVVKMLAPKVMKAVGASGFNLMQNNESVAGQVVMHTHFHIVPRIDSKEVTLWPGHDIDKADLEKISEIIKTQI